MNKKELIDSIAAKANVKKVDAEKVLTCFEKTIVDVLKADGKVTLVGFGTFSVTHRKERRGRNPRTKEEIVIPARKSPKFVVGKSFKSAIAD